MTAARSLAAIDVGTNSVLLTVAAVDVHGPRRAGAFERVEITRLGRGVDRRRALDPEAAAATLACLTRYAADVREQGARLVDVVGTSALRDAADGPAFAARAEEILGVRPRILSGEEEASATFEGALVELDARAPRAVVIDVGGGSTEIVLGDPSTGEVAFRASADVGAVRLTERHVATDPPRDEELAAVAADARRALEALRAPRLDGARLVGVAGTLTTLAALDLGLARYEPTRIHGHAMSPSALDALLRALAREDAPARAARPCLDPKRADVVVAGAAILREVAAWAAALGADPSGLLVSDGGVRWGLLARAARSLDKTHHP